MTTVRINGLTIDANKLDRLPVAEFERARNQAGHALCLCTRPYPKLVIRCRASRWHLARWPGDRHAHARACVYRGGDDGLFTGASYYRGAIEKTAAGDRLHVAINLESTDGIARKERNKQTPRINPSQGSGRMQLLGLLHYLWETAGLNTWKPGGSRAWGPIAQRLKAASERCSINGQVNALYVVPQWHPTKAAELAAKFEAFRNGLSMTQRGLVVGELKTIQPAPYGHRVRLSHLGKPMFVGDEAPRQWKRSYPTAVNASSLNGARCIGIWLIDHTPKGNHRVVDSALMATTLEGIPVDSSHEFTMAQHLVANGRNFMKPLRYASEAVFPDFVLMDPLVYVEVYGMTGMTSYDARRKRKEAYYRSEGIPVIAWDPTTHATPPTVANTVSYYLRGFA